MKGFIVFEVSPPILWKPLYEHKHEFYRVTWLWFSITLACGTGLAYFVDDHSTEPDQNEDEHESSLGIG